MGQLYTDSLVHDEKALKYLVSIMGIDKVMLGSDYPFPLGEHHPGKLVESILDWDQSTKVIPILCEAILISLVNRIKFWGRMLWNS